MRQFFGRPAAAFVIVRDGNKVLMVKRIGPWRPGEFTMPSGHVEGGESVRAAAQRELKEEVGLDVVSEDLRFVHVCNRSAEPEIEQDPEYLDFYFEAIKYSGAPQNMEPDKHSEVTWIDIRDLDEHPVVNYNKDALRAIDRKEPYGEFGW